MTVFILHERHHRVSTLVNTIVGWVGLAKIGSDVDVVQFVVLACVVRVMSSENGKCALSPE